LEDHFRHLETVFQRLREAGLKLKLKKCSFVKDSVPYLGHIVSATGLATDPTKVALMANFPAPKNVKLLQTFLGLSNYYRRFVPNFAQLTHPLTELTKKDVEFIWGERQEKSFKSLKERLVSSPVLAFPDFTKPFIVCTDTRDHGVGAVLVQKQEVPGIGEAEVIAMSRHLLERERHWASVEKEAFANIQACKTFFPYLYGRTFTVVTDHKPLQWLASIKEPTGRLMRWSLWLKLFNMTIGYCTGKTNQNADCLSRTPVKWILPTRPTSPNPLSR
jgi:RNase H-like domain found in reverse transcriptase